MGMEINLSNLPLSTLQGIFTPEQINELGGYQNLSNVSADKLLTILAEAVTAQGNQVSIVDDIDTPNTKASDGQKNLEKIIALLQMMTDEKQVKEAKQRLENDKGAIKNQHQAQMDKIKESVEAAEKAEKNSKVAKAFAWIGAAIAIAVAAVACIASGGIAVGPCVAALLAVASLVVTSSDKVSDAITKGLGKFCNAVQKLFTGKDLTKDQQKMAGTILFTGIMLAASIATLCIPSNAVISIGQASEKLARAASIIGIATKVANGVMTVGNTGVSLAGGILNNQAAQASADTKEIDRILKALEEMTEEEKDLLQQLLDQLQSSVSGVMNLVDAQIQTSRDIVTRMGQSGAAMV